MNVVGSILLCLFVTSLYFSSPTMAADQDDSSASSSAVSLPEGKPITRREFGFFASDVVRTQLNIEREPQAQDENDAADEIIYHIDYTPVHAHPTPPGGPPADQHDIRGEDEVVYHVDYTPAHTHPTPPGGPHTQYDNGGEEELVYHVDYSPVHTHPTPPPNIANGGEEEPVYHVDYSPVHTHPTPPPNIA